MSVIPTTTSLVAIRTCAVVGGPPSMAAVTAYAWSRAAVAGEVRVKVYAPSARPATSYGTLAGVIVQPAGGVTLTVPRALVGPALSTLAVTVVESPGAAISVGVATTAVSRAGGRTTSRPARSAVEPPDQFTVAASEAVPVASAATVTWYR